MKYNNIASATFFLSLICAFFLQITSCKTVNGDYHIKLVLASDDTQNLTLEESQSILTILQDRLQTYGYYSHNFSLQASGNQLLVEVHNADDPVRLKRLLATRAKLDFAAVHNIKNRLSRIKGLYQGLLQKVDDAVLSDAFGAVAAADTAKLSRYLNHPSIAALYPKGTRFVLSAKPISNTNNYLVYALDYHNNDLILNANYWLKGTYSFIPNEATQEAVVVVEISEERRAQWQKFVRRKKGLGLAFMLDGRVYSTTSLDSEALYKGNLTLSGDFTKESGQDLVDILEHEPLPCQLLIVDEHITKIKRE